MKQRIGQIGNIPLVIGDEHEITSNEILVEQSKSDPNKIDIKRRINGKLKTLTNTQGETRTIKITQPKPKIPKIYLQTPKFLTEKVYNSGNIERGLCPIYTPYTMRELYTIYQNIKERDTINPENREFIEHYDSGACPLYLGKIYEGINIISLRELFRVITNITIDIEKSEYRYYSDSTIDSTEYRPSIIGNYIDEYWGCIPLFLECNKGDITHYYIELPYLEQLKQNNITYIVVYVKNGQIVSNQERLYFKDIFELNQFLPENLKIIKGSIVNNDQVLGHSIRKICNAGKFYNIFNRMYRKDAKQQITVNKDLADIDPGAIELLISDDSSSIITTNFSGLPKKNTRVFLRQLLIRNEIIKDGATIRWITSGPRVNGSMSLSMITPFLNFEFIVNTIKNI